MPEPEEITIVLTKDGRMIVSVCSACVLGAKDDRCAPQASKFVNDLISEGHVAEMREPAQDPVL